MIATLLSHRELIFTLVKRDLKVRYKASTLGFLWSFGKPLFLMIVMWAVFSQIVRAFNTEIPYALHLLTALLPWMYFQGAIQEAQVAIIINTNVVKKVSLPTEVFPVSAVLGNLVHFFLALSMLTIFIIGYTIFDPTLAPGWEIIFLPLIILLQTVMLVGVALLLSALNVTFRDVGSISEILLMAWFYFTPIIYPVQEARDHLKALSENSDIFYYIYLCNPMTPIIVAYRRVLYGNHLSKAPEVADSTLLLGLGLSTAFALLMVAIGAYIFRKMAPRFADEL